MVPLNENQECSKEDRKPIPNHNHFMTINSETLTYSVPKERLAIENLKTLLPAFRDKKLVSKNKLAKLIGILSWCCFGVKSGRTFLRRLIELSKSMVYQTDIIYWWIKYAPMYLGISKIIGPTWRGDIIFHTDSSGRFCVGVWWDRWFVYKFTEEDKKISHSQMHRYLNKRTICSSDGMQNL